MLSLSFFNETNGTNGSTNHQHSSDIRWTTILLGVLLFSIIFITLFGNLLVLIAVKQDKRLHTLFNYYIVNLAITDVSVAVTAMSFYTIDNILGYWPFGEFLCGVWVFFDYGMTFASVFTLLVISIDRFWSVTWSMHYRLHHTKKKCLISIIIVWILMFALWLPACISDRLRNNTPGTCLWEPSLNQNYVIVIAIFGHHGSCVIMLVCYLRVFLFMRKRAKMVEDTREVNQTQFRLGLPSRSTDQRSISRVTTTHTILGSTSISTEHQQEEKVEDKTANRQGISYIREADAISRSDQTQWQIIRDRRVFNTLTYIICGYVVCWVPFHIVFDISAISPTSIPGPVYTLTYWLAYGNSTVNPFLYNFSSLEFRRAFRKLLCRGESHVRPLEHGQ